MAAAAESAAANATQAMKVKSGSNQAMNETKKIFGCGLMPAFID